MILLSMILPNQSSHSSETHPQNHQSPLSIPSMPIIPSMSSQLAAGGGAAWVGLRFGHPIVVAREEQAQTTQTNWWREHSDRHPPYGGNRPSASSVRQAQGRQGRQGRQTNTDAASGRRRRGSITLGQGIWVLSYSFFPYGKEP